MAGTSTKVIVTAFLMNLGIAIAKIIAAIFTGSTAMMAEGLHSIADSSNQIFLYLGVRKSKKLPDETHPFGYGNEQYVWSFLVAILIFLLGAIYSLYEGIHKLKEILIEGTSTPIEGIHVNIIILVLAIFMEGYSSFVATREFNKIRGNSTFWQFAHRSKDQVLVTVLFEDYAALIGLGIALIGSILYWITELPIFDAVATVLIGILLAIIAVFLYRETKSLLVGESASVEDEEAIRKVFEAHPKVIKLTELLTLHFGPSKILVNAHVKFKDGLTLKAVEDVVDEIEEEISGKVPDVFKIFIETHQRAKVKEIQPKEKKKTK